MPVPDPAEDAYFQTAGWGSDSDLEEEEKGETGEEPCSERVQAPDLPTEDSEVSQSGLAPVHC